MQNDLLRRRCLVLLLLLLMQNGLIQCTTHLLLVKVMLLHIQTELLKARAHRIHDLIVHIHVNQLGISCMVVLVRFKVSLIDVVGHVPCACGQLGNVVSLLQSGVPQPG